ncbi:HAD family hydrolase [Candidatus Halobeggiatoa sp. HSG11]|nr:HAD family hydrolase [Candidatus Halobeggiatoa sp. HSG11]
MELFKRLLFSLRMSYRYCQDLNKICRTTPNNLKLCDISPKDFQQQGIEVLILDFDGVLASHGDLFPVEELYEWLHNCVKAFGAEQIFILSNKPLAKRITYFEQHYPGIRYIKEVKKKPYPDGLQKIISLTKKPPKSLMLVDDRLLTGSLAACIANVSVTYITKPYTCISKRPIIEMFFMSLRFLERWFVTILAWLYIS